MLTAPRSIQNSPAVHATLEPGPQTILDCPGLLPTHEPVSRGGTRDQVISLSARANASYRAHVGQPDDARLEARLGALAARIDAALALASARIAIPETGVQEGARRAELDALRGKLGAAEANVSLQAQRCAALEDRIAELEAALVGAREERARAEAMAEHAQREAELALDQLDNARSERSTPIDSSLGATLQEKLLEIERLTRERDALRESSSDWRSRAQAYRRERDEATLTLSRTTSELEDLRERDVAARRKLGELERRLSEKERALEVATRRAEHLRQHLGS